MHSFFYTASLLATVLISPGLAHGEESTTVPAPTCEVKGFDKSHAYNFNDDAALATFDACSARCAAEVACVSFAYGGSQCLLYTQDTASNVDVNADSPFIFNDRDCAQYPVSSTSTPVSESTESASSTLEPPPYSTKTAESSDVTEAPTDSYPESPETVTSHVDVTVTSWPPEVASCTTPATEGPVSQETEHIPKPETTIVTTQYVGICPTGYTTIPYTMTVTTTPGAADTPAPASEVPEGFTTTVVVCPQCSAASPSVTLTVPVMSVVPVPDTAETHPPANLPSESASGEMPVETPGDVSSGENTTEGPAPGGQPPENYSPQEHPAGETAGGNAGEVPSQEHPSDQSPSGGQTPESYPPAQEHPAGETPGEVPSEEHSSDESPSGGEMPEGSSPEQSPPQETSGDVPGEGPSEGHPSGDSPSGGDVLEVHSAEQTPEETSGEIPSEHAPEASPSGEPAADSSPEGHPADVTPYGDYLSGGAPPGDEVHGSSEDSVAGETPEEIPAGDVPSENSSEESVGDQHSPETPAESPDSHGLEGVAAEPTDAGSEDAGAEAVVVSPPYSPSNANISVTTAAATGTGVSGAEGTWPVEFAGAGSKVTTGAFGAVVMAAAALMMM